MSKKQLIIIGIVSPLGTNIDVFKNKASTLIKNRYNAEVHTVALSELIHSTYSSELSVVGYTKQTKLQQLKTKIELGNRIRRDYKKNDMFAEFALLKVVSKYREILKSSKDKHVIFIDQLKRPEEVKFLEQIFGNGFWLIGLEASIENRIQNLTMADDSLIEDVNKLIFVDENEENNTYGQRMRKTFLNSHAVFNDSFDSQQVEKFFDLIHGSHVVLPTQDEYYMNLAFDASLKAGDLSRQVGAILVSANNDQIACGANEVNKFGGGSYWNTDGSQSDLKRSFDPNKKIIQEIKSELKKRIEAHGLNAEEASELLDKSKLDDLTEFHRTTHAEMDAILSAQRSGISIINSTLYCTTFPCHNCAKHIVSAGIKKIIYQEPYPKSLALRLHDDSISTVEVENKVFLSFFQGITHKRFRELFSLAYSSGVEVRRKEGEEVKAFNPKAANLRFKVNERIFNRVSLIALDTFKKDGSIRLGKIA